MSKEQTPTTAWEFYKNSDTANVYEVMEQYAQYREKKAVQEALESEVPKAYISGGIDAHRPVENMVDQLEYYQKQVKPKYE